MPPKPKYTKEQIIQIALELVSQKGSDELTAKKLGDALNMSTTPVFTVFDSMQEVHDAVKIAAMERFESYAHSQDGSMPKFKQVGMQMIMFAKDEPNLYHFIFMSPNSGVTPFDNNYYCLGSVAKECLEAIERDYNLSENDSKTLFEHVWIHTFGIGVLCATGACNFSYDQISDMLTQDFTAMMTLLKSERGV